MQNMTFEILLDLGSKLCRNSRSADFMDRAIPLSSVCAAGSPQSNGIILPLVNLTETGNVCRFVTTAAINSAAMQVVDNDNCPSSFTAVGRHHRRKDDASQRRRQGR